jgi:hypothetical protein
MHSTPYLGAILAVVDSEFTVICPDWTKISELEVLLPLTIESRKIWAYSHVVSSDTYGNPDTVN